MRALIALATGACWTAPPMTPPPSPGPVELRATLRIEPQRHDKHFQGVWLELADHKRWVIDYRANEIWRSFEDADVIVTGGCYAPEGEAVMATHFKVDHMRLASPRTAPLREIHGELVRHGRFTTHAYPAGSKLADSPETTFVSDGTEYWIAGADLPVPAPGTEARILTRDVIVEPSYTALAGGPRLWLVAIDQGAETPASIRCP